MFHNSYVPAGKAPYTMKLCFSSNRYPVNINREFFNKKENSSMQDDDQQDME